MGGVNHEIFSCNYWLSWIILFLFLVVQHWVELWNMFETCRGDISNHVYGKMMLRIWEYSNRYPLYSWSVFSTCIWIWKRPNIFGLLVHFSLLIWVLILVSSEILSQLASAVSSCLPLAVCTSISSGSKRHASRLASHWLRCACPIKGWNWKISQWLYTSAISYSLVYRSRCFNTICCQWWAYSALPVGMPRLDLSWFCNIQLHDLSLLYFCLVMWGSPEKFQVCSQILGFSLKSVKRILFLHL